MKLARTIRPILTLCSAGGFSRIQPATTVFFSHAKSAQPPANQPANSIFLSREISQPSSQPASRTRRVAQKRTVAEALVQRRWIRDIQGRLTILVLRDYVLLWQTPMDVHLSTDMDRFSWRWTATEDYTATSAYKIMHISKTRRSPGLEELGTPAGEVLHLACSQTSAMDNGQTTATWTGCT